MDLPTIVLPDTVQIKTPSLPLPTADVPSYQPLVVPPQDLRRPEGTEEVRTEENPPPKIHYRAMNGFVEVVIYTILYETLIYIITIMVLLRMLL